MLGRGIRVDLPSIADKLVHRRRGGYCFEHGQLLAAALVRLGYPVDRLLARVGGPHDAAGHLVLRVRVAGQDWLADTGFGTGLIEPVPFGDGAPRNQYGWTYRLRADGAHHWQLQERQGDDWATLYQFDDQPQYPADVLVANHFTSTYPDSSVRPAAGGDPQGPRRPAPADRAPAEHHPPGPARRRAPPGRPRLRRRADRDLRTAAQRRGIRPADRVTGTPGS